MNAHAQPGEPHQPRDRAYLYLVVMVAAVGGFLFGFDTMIFSSALIYLKETFSLSDAQTGFAGSGVILGCLVGTFAATFASDLLGRKKTMILAALLFAVSAVGTAIPQTFWQWNAFRILGGIGIGVAMVISPVYIAEIAPTSIRGNLVTLNQFIIVAGALFALFIGFLLAKYVAQSYSWRLMFLSECVPIACLAVGLTYIPESPRWLVEKDRGDLALEILTRINGPAQGEIEVQAITESIKLEEEQQAASYKELLLPGVRVAMVVAIGLAVFQQISGGMPLALYAPLIYQGAGFTDTPDSIKATIFIYVWSMVCVVIVMLLVERVGRRPMLLWGMSGMVGGHLVLAYCFHRELTGIIVPIVVTLTIGMSNLSISPLAGLFWPRYSPRASAGGRWASPRSYSSSRCIRSTNCSRS